MNSVSIAPSTTTCATWMFFGPSSRAMLWASARSPCFAPAKAEKPAPPRSDAVAPVKRIVPRPRGSIDLRGLAAGQEAREAGHLPDLRVDARGGLDDAEADVAADVEDGDLDRADVALDPLEQRDDLLLPAGVGPERERAAARGLDRRDERLRASPRCAAPPP